MIVRRPYGGAEQVDWDDDWPAKVRQAVAEALNTGSAFVPRDVAHPDVAEEEARRCLDEWGRAHAIGFTDEFDRLRLTRDDDESRGITQAP